MITSKIIRFILKFLAWLGAILVGLCLLVWIGFYSFRGKIYERVLTTFNASRPGELQADQIHIAPLGFYPFLAVRFDNVAFYENKQASGDVSTVPLLKLERLYIGWKYNNLFQKEFRLGGLALENGQINLEVREDSTLNFLTGWRKHDWPGPEASTKEDPFGKLDLLELVNVEVIQHNQITGEQLHVRLNEVNNHYEEIGDTVRATLAGEVNIISLSGNNKNLIRKKSFSMDLDYGWSLSSLQGTIDTGTISLGQANLNMEGAFFGGAPAGYDLHFFFNKEGLDTIDIDDPNTFLQEGGGGPGKIFLEGFLRGNTLDPLPYAEVTIRIEDLAVNDPMGDSTLHDINLAGYFCTGDSADLSEAELRIDRFSLVAGTDQHAGNLAVRNFVTPAVTLDLDSRIEMRDLDKYFAFDFITDLGGFIEISADIDGIMDFENQDILKDAGTVDIRFDDFSCLIPGTGQYIDRVSGSLTFVEEKINLEELSILSGSNDLLINGSVSNLAYLFSLEDAPVNGFIDLQAGKLGLNELISPDSLLFSPGNDVLEDLELKLNVNTSSAELREPGWLPDGDFFVERLSAKLSYLPDPVIYSGRFFVREEMAMAGDNQVSLEKYNLSIQNMHVRTGDNDLIINGILASQIDPEDPGSSPVTGNLSLQSDRLALSSIFAFDPILESSYKEVISDADIMISYETSLQNLAESWYLPRGEISLDHFSVKLKNRANIRDAVGTLTVTDFSIVLDDLKGIYGESDIVFSAHVNNYPGFWRTDTAMEIDIGLSARSDLMRADDFFTYKNNFYLIGKYRGESLEDFALSANFHYVNQDLFGARVLPDARIEITDLQWRTSYDQLFFRDFHIALVREGKDLELKDFKGKIGESDFAFRAYLRNFTPFTDPDLSDFSADFNIQAASLDLNELTGIKFPKAEQPKFNPFRFIYHDLSLELDVDRLSYKDFVVSNIDGDLHTERGNKIHLDELSMETAGGRLQISAELDTRDPEAVLMKSEINARNIQVDKVLLNFQLKEEEISPAEYFKGDLSVRASSEVHLDPDFKINLAQSGGTLDFALKEGQIQDYPPMQELAKYFRDKDLSKVRMESEVDGITVDKGTINIPRMAVNSTLGHLYFTGTYDLEEGVEYIFEVPFRLVANTAWGMLVKRSRDEGAQEDEIQTPSRGAYITLRLLSSEEGGYEMKLGKGKREKRKAERREKREARRTIP